MTGGEVRGKRILGEYPSVLSEDGPDIIKPGIVIPSTPWESIWNGVAQWFGVEDAVSTCDKIIYAEKMREQC